MLLPLDQIMLYPVENRGEDFLFAADVELSVGNQILDLGGIKTELD